MTCPNCAGTGITLNPQVYVEWGNPNSGTLPLTTTCECMTQTTITGGQDADELDTPSALNPTQRLKTIVKD